MNLVIASGKGGTGKTTLATAIFTVLGNSVRLLDADVEEPNAVLFFDVEEIRKEDVCLPMPKISSSRCGNCGRCIQICRYGAISPSANGIPEIHSELCHSCGACSLACRWGAITEQQTRVGELRHLIWKDREIIEGRVDVGRPSATPVIRELMKYSSHTQWTIIDAPPGTACGLAATLRMADAALLVAEPTPFGVHDLDLAIEACQDRNLLTGVVINRYGIGDDSVERLCKERNIPVWLKIPDSKEASRELRRGQRLPEIMPEIVPQLLATLDLISREVHN